MNPHNRDVNKAGPLRVRPADPRVSAWQAGRPVSNVSARACNMMEQIRPALRVPAGHGPARIFSENFLIKKNRYKSIKFSKNFGVKDFYRKRSIKIVKFRRSSPNAQNFFGIFPKFRKRLRPTGMTGRYGYGSTPSGLVNITDP